MDAIIKQTLIQIAITAYNAGKNGMTNEAFLMLLNETLKQTDEYAAEEEVKSYDPDYAINWSQLSTGLEAHKERLSIRRKGAEGNIFLSQMRTRVLGKVARWGKAHKVLRQMFFQVT